MASNYSGRDRRHGPAQPDAECANISTWRDTAAEFNHRLSAIEGLLADHIRDERAQQAEILAMLTAWHNAQFTVRLVRWIVPVLAGAVVGGWAVMAWLREHFRW